MDEIFREDPYAFARHIGMVMTEWREDYAAFDLPLEGFLMNRHDNPHGGVHASLLDTVMGYAGCWTGEVDRRQLCLTLSLNVQYLSRPRGKVLKGQGWRTGGGKATFFAEAQIADETGELIAKGTGVFKYRR